MITNRVIQAWYDKANTQGTDVMRWSDFFACMTELKNTATTDYSLKPVMFDDLPVYADDTAAGTGGLTGGELYRTTTGEVRIKLPAT